MTKKIAYIDHYDSFTFNVIDWLKRGGCAIDYVAYDCPKDLERIAAEQLPVVLSPGPKHPDDAPTTLAFIEKILGTTPILGICLGHQQLAAVAGAQIVRARAPFHGTTRTIAVLDHTDLFCGLPRQFKAACYNSLIVAAKTSAIDVLAVCEDREIQALRVTDSRVAAWGVQFHPESFMSEQADRLRDNWLASWCSDVG